MHAIGFINKTCVALLALTTWAGFAAPLGAQSPLIPREILFGNPDRAGVRISPNGKWISFRAPVEGVMNVWTAPADDLSAAKPVTRDKGRGIRAYFWAHTSQHIIYLQDRDGDENWHLYAVGLVDGKEKDLTPFEGVAARVQEVSHKHPEDILVAVNNRNPQFHDIHRVNIVTGKHTLLAENNEGFVGYLSDDDLKLHFAIKMTPDGGSEILRTVEPGKWTSFARVGREDSLTTSVLGMAKDGTHVYMFDSRNRDTAALTLVDIASGESRVLVEDPQSDIQGMIGHPRERHIQAASSNFTRRRWHILDDSLRPDFEKLEQVSRGEFNILSRTLDDTQWIVAYETDNGPVKYYRYFRPRREATFLFTNRGDLEDQPLASTHPVVIKARDGLDLVSYYTLPTWTDADGDGQPKAALPMVLLVHGGPWGRDAWGYDPYHQWLANRGYAVLSVNFRGSTGFGKKFINAGDMEWAGKMHDDLLDAVDWAVGKHIADPRRVAIMGGSYGGYATLVGLAYTPEKFACGVDIVGPSNLLTLLSTIPPYWTPMIDLFTQRVGDHRTEEGRKHLAERSPLHRAEHIVRPLLIGQGANDPRVKQAESDQIVEAMKRKNIPVTYTLFPDEGHGFARPENRMAFNAVTEVFLARHLGGRSEPISQDIVESSITVPAGGEDIPGLLEMLERRTKPADPVQ